MEKRPLGLVGPLVSAVGLGCNNFGRIGSATETLDGTAAVLAAAIESGVTLVDTADTYGAPPLGGAHGQSEALIGEALLGRRDEVVLATKFGNPRTDPSFMPGVPKGSREYIRAAVEASLGRLRTDWIDLYQQHMPDPSTPIAETIGALEELVAEGRIRWYGHSNFSAEQIRAADVAAKAMGVTGFVSAQDEYSLLERGAEGAKLPAVRELGLGFLPYYPLASGLLTGKFRRDEPPAADTRIGRQKPEAHASAPWDALEEFAAWCAARGVTMLQASFGWLLAQPALASVIAGATRPEQVRANAEAADWTPTPDEAAEISAIFARG